MHRYCPNLGMGLTQTLLKIVISHVLSRHRRKKDQVAWIGVQCQKVNILSLLSLSIRYMQCDRYHSISSAKTLLRLLSFWHHGILLKKEYSQWDGISLLLRDHLPRDMFFRALPEKRGWGGETQPPELFGSKCNFGLFLHKVVQVARFGGGCFRGEIMK